MEIIENQSLKALNTFGVDVKSRFFVELTDVKALYQINSLPKPHLFLGGGSNILFVNDYPGTVIHNNLLGVSILKETSESVVVKAMGGENWHQFVIKMSNAGFHGLEYLALIPGTVGAAPVQNIGAYGAEVKQFIQSVEVFDCEAETIYSIPCHECYFSYRDSLFKQEKGRYFIISVTFELLKKVEAKVEYRALEHYFEGQGKALEDVSMQDIFEGVVSVRASKLPDPKEIGNGGSFFKNPIVSKSKAKELYDKYSNLVMYPHGVDKIKLAAGQLIELSGLKGKYVNNVGMYEKQALVLVNLGGATGGQLWAHAQKVQEQVAATFGVMLEPEPLIL